jgi:PAS domain S-box-containing protein
MKRIRTDTFWPSAGLCLVGSVILALLTFICFRLNALPSVAALLYMVVVVLVSLRGQFIPAVFVSIAAICCLDYFFVQPIFRLAMTEALDVVGIIAYLTTALVVTRLLSRVNKSFQELRESESRFRAMADTAPVLIWMAGTDLLRNFFNRPWLAFTGRTLDRELNNSWALGVHAEDWQRCRETFVSSCAARQPFTVEYRLRRRDGEYRWLLDSGVPRYTAKGELLGFIGSCIDITERKRTEEQQADVAREREMFAQQRAAELGKANDALRGCLDALASVPELDDFIGQIMAATTRQLGASSSTLRVLNSEQDTLTVELVFQDGRAMSAAEARFPEIWRSVSMDDDHAANLLRQPTTVIDLLDPDSAMPEAIRSYWLGLGVKTLLIIPLTVREQAHGILAFSFAEKRDFDPEEVELARALATQASLAIYLTRLARTAKQSAVLEERNRLASEIHDSLAQSFAGISMQLFAAEEVIKTNNENGLNYVERANDLARFGLAEARRSVLSLRSDVIEESGLIEALQMLTERSNIPGRLRCTFRSAGVREEDLPLPIQQGLLGIAQEAISNALRHAKPTVVGVYLRLDTPHLILEIRDNGLGIPDVREEKGPGFGLANMRARAESLGAGFDIRTAPGGGTTITVRLPFNS